MKTRTKSNITLALIILSMGLFCCSIFAQPPKGQKPPKGPSEEQVAKMIDEITESLSLTAEQEMQINTAFTNHFKALKTLHKGEQSKREENKTQHDKLRKDFHKQIESILNEDQIKEFQVIMEKYKPKDRPSKSK